MAPLPSEHPKLHGKAVLRDRVLTVVASLAIFAAAALVLWTGELLLLAGHVHFAEESHEFAVLDVRNLQYALKHFHTRHQRYPTTEEGLQVLVSGHSLEQLPLDPWGRPYGYALHKGLPVVWSYGADGEPGGEGPDADISSR